MRKKEFRTLTEIGKDLDKVSSMQCRPDWKKPKEGFIFDEEKSVKWNREEVLRKQEEFDNEVKRLNTEKNKRRDTLLNELYEVITNELKGITVKDAKRIFDFAYERESSWGYNDVIIFIYDLIDVFEPMLRK